MYIYVHMFFEGKTFLMNLCIHAVTETMRCYVTVEHLNLSLYNYANFYSVSTMVMNILAIKIPGRVS